MKKYISFVIAAVVLVALFALPAAAATTGVLAMEDVSGKPGDTVAVNVNMSANPGLVTLGIKVEYDANVLQLTQVKATDLLKGAQLSKKYSSPYTITWIDGATKDNNTKTGTIVTFYFQIKDSAPEGKSPVVLNFMDSYRTDYSANQFETKSGAVIIDNQAPSQGAEDATETIVSSEPSKPEATTPPVITPGAIVPEETVPGQTAPAEPVTGESEPAQTAPTEIATDESVENKNESEESKETDVITIGTMPVEKTENQQEDPAFPWWILLVLIPGVAVAVVLIIKKVKK